MIKHYPVIAIAFFIFALSVADICADDEARLQRLEYCEMIKLYKDTNGEAGWPAYAGEC